MPIFKPAMTIEEAHRICSDADIFLVKYSGAARSKSVLQCPHCEHRWENSLLNIKRGSRCPNCTKRHAKQSTAFFFTEEEVAALKALAKEKIDRDNYLDSASKNMTIAQQATEAKERQRQFVSTVTGS